MVNLNYPPKYSGSLKTWWDCSDPAGNGIKPSNGATVSKIVNKATPGTYDMIGATGFSGAISGTYDGSLNAVSFAANKTNYISTYPANPSTETVFLVFNGITSGSQCIIGSTNVVAGANGSGGREVPLFTSQFGYTIAGCTSVTITLDNSTATTSMGCIILDSAPPSASINNIHMSVNGNFPQTDKRFGTTATFGSGTYTGFGNEGSAAQFVGKIMEIIIYNVALNTDQRQTVEGYLAWKWLINGLLPTVPIVHPYKYAAPQLPVTGYKNSAGADLITLFASGNSGITTGYKSFINGAYADLGSIFASGNSGLTTGYKNSAGVDLGNLFAIL